jgi:hypothetical protein
MAQVPGSERRSRVGTVRSTDVIGGVRDSAHRARGRTSAVRARFLCEVDVHLAAPLSGEATGWPPAANGVDPRPGKQEAAVAVSRQPRVRAGALIEGALRTSRHGDHLAQISRADRRRRGGDGRYSRPSRRMKST